MFPSAYVLKYTYKSQMCVWHGFCREIPYNYLVKILKIALTSPSLKFQNKWLIIHRSAQWSSVGTRRNIHFRLEGCLTALSECLHASASGPQTAGDCVTHLHSASVEMLERVRLCLHQVLKERSSSIQWRCPCWDLNFSRIWGEQLSQLLSTVVTLVAPSPRSDRCAWHPLKRNTRSEGFATVLACYFISSHYCGAYNVKWH